MADIRADIQETMDNFAKAFNTLRDLEALGKLYVDDCGIMAPDTPLKFGRDAFLAGMSDWFRKGIDRIAFTTDDYGGSGDQVWKRGSFTTYSKDNTIFAMGKDVNIFKRVGGKLLFVIDVWNFDSPH